MFFESWASLGRTLVTGICAYAAVIAFLRVSGKRTLAKMNAFDLVVTIALGSTLSTILLSKDVAIAEGLLAMALLIALQYLVATLNMRSRRARKLLKSQPAEVFANGNFREDQMRNERLGEDEILAAIRHSGHSDLSEIGSVVLETDGSFSVLERRNPAGEPALRDVKGWRENGA